MPIIIAIAIALGIGGGAVIASGRALPGDALYELKARYVEELRAVLSVSAEAQAEWAAERAERRLEEAERLTVEGELKAETRQRLQERFILLTDLAKTRLEAAVERDPQSAAEVGAEFAAALEAHERILAMLAVNGAEGAEKVEIVALQEAVDAKGSEAAGLRARLETSMTDGTDPQGARPAAEGRRRAAEETIREVRHRLSRTSGRLDAEAVAQADARIRVAEAGLADGDAKLEADAPAAAFVSFSTAFRLAQEARRLITARSSLGIDVGLGGVGDAGQLYEALPVPEAATETENDPRIDLDATLRAPLGN